MTLRRIFVGTWLATACFGLGCGQEEQQPAASRATDGTDEQEEQVAAPSGEDQSPPAGEPQRIETANLPNAVKVHDKVISGGQPDGEAAFAELKSLGVRTVISVDGARPDVETAAKYGLRYVHLPHGYDGIPENQVKELAKAVRDLDGPIYIHCHHGRHRSPAAASVACVAANLIRPESALSILHLAGTSKNYRGLYESAESAHPLEQALLDELEVEFRDSVELPPMAEAMVAVEQTHDRINEIAVAGWRVPAAHPDLDPPHEALLLREHFTELLRADYVREQPEVFREILHKSEAAAQELERALRGWRPVTAQERPPAALQALADRITANCKACHAQFRDVPLSEK